MTLVSVILYARQAEIQSPQHIIVQTDAHNYLVNANFQEAVADEFLFTSVADALRAAEKAQAEAPQLFSEEKPLTIHIAPSVYWLDDPDDPEIRKPLPGEGIPFGMKLKLSHLRLKGMGAAPDEVILASNRGQTHGAVGNFTMLHFTGDDIQAENLTFGNYCNVDLEYKLNPQMNRKRRADAIVQGQLIICNGDKYVARNCRFISRLNLCPFAGAKRAFFDNCYFESTDDALCGTAVYLNCRFTFFSSKPFYATHNTGAVFLNCDIHSLVKGRQYLVKVGSPVTMVDCRWTSEDKELYIGWTQDPTDDQRSYQYNLTLNGKPLMMDAERPWLTVDMTGKELLKAYKLEDGRYNLYNLLHGNDGWNPAQAPTDGVAASVRPTLVSCSAKRGVVESGVDKLTLKGCAQAFSTFPDFNRPSGNVQWSVSPEEAPYVKLTPQPDGTCLVEGTNEEEETRIVQVLATTASGLETACVLTVKPRQLTPPAFVKEPRIKQKGNLLFVEYELDLEGRQDESLVTWYRCADKQGEKEAVAVAVSRNNTPLKAYELTGADKGKFMRVSVAPKHLRCAPGEAEWAVTAKPVKVKKVNEQVIETDFVNFPGETQPRIEPGYWTADNYKPLDTEAFNWEADNSLPAWYYGEGMDGAKGVTGLIQTIKGARLLYTPLQAECGDMSVTLHLNPCKSAGQGFGSATGQYLDIYIKFDTKTLSGYALRIIRTPKNDSAVDFMLMKYENGRTTPITEAVSSICYRTGCQVTLTAQGNLLKAEVKNVNKLPAIHKAGLTDSVSLQAEMEATSFGGLGVQHTGSTGASATVISYLKAVYK